MNTEILTEIEDGVCAAKGFKANGLNCGLNSDKNKNDLGMVASDVICNAAAVYTTNKVKGAPILVTKKHLELPQERHRQLLSIQKMQTHVTQMASRRQRQYPSLQLKNLALM